METVALGPFSLLKARTDPCRHLLSSNCFLSRTCCLPTKYTLLRAEGLTWKAWLLFCEWDTAAKTPTELVLCKWEDSGTLRALFGFIAARVFFLPLWPLPCELSFSSARHMEWDLCCCRPAYHVFLGWLSQRTLTFFCSVYLISFHSEYFLWGFFILHLKKCDGTCQLYDTPCCCECINSINTQCSSLGCIHVYYYEGIKIKTGLNLRKLTNLC